MIQTRVTLTGDLLPDNFFSVNAYLELANRLKEKGIDCYMQGTDQLIVSNENPALPSSNCFWAIKKDDDWYVGTWLPAAYHVPTEADIGNICEVIFRSSDKAIYTIDPDLASRMRLRRLDDDEIETLGFV